MNETGESPFKVELTPKQPPKMDRRNFLKLLAGGVGVLAAASCGLPLALELGRGKKENEFVITENPIIKQLVDNYGFKPEKVRKIIQEKKLPPENYGILAASAVTFLSTKTTEDGNTTYGLGSGGVAEYQGKYYLLTTMHVIGGWLSQEFQKLYFSIPETGAIYECIPAEINTFGTAPTLDKDELTLIELNNEKIRETLNHLKRNHALTPLIPMAYSSGLDKTAIFFRFQGENPSWQEVQIEKAEPTSSGSSVTASLISDKPMACGGTSGTPILQSKEGLLTNICLGAVAVAVGADKSDSAGILGNCGTQLGFNSPYEISQARGLVSRKTWVE